MRVSISGAFFLNFVKKYRVLMFTKSNCPVCENAKVELMKLGHKTHIVDVDQSPNKESMKKFLYEYTGKSNLPLVFIHGKFLCEGKNIVDVQKRGILQKYLEESDEEN